MCRVQVSHNAFLTFQPPEDDDNDNDNDDDDDDDDDTNQPAGRRLDGLRVHRQEQEQEQGQELAHTERGKHHICSTAEPTAILSTDAKRWSDQVNRVANPLCLCSTYRERVLFDGTCFCSEYNYNTTTRKI